MRWPKSLKTQRARRAVRSPTGRSTQKNKCPFVNFFGPPLRPEHSLQAPAVSKQSRQSEGLAQNAASDSDPTTRARGNPAHRSSPTGALRTDWSRLIGDTPFGRNQKTCGERQGMAHRSKPMYQGPYPARKQCSAATLTQSIIGAARNSHMVSPPRVSGHRLQYRL